MARITSTQADLVAWYCEFCGRMEGPATERRCPDCDEKRRRVSRYEWFLADALERELKTAGRQFRITEQWALPDHRGFSWYFDLAVWVQGGNPFGGITELIEVQGPTHARQPNYKGPGGGYTRDQDKHWELFSVNRLHKQGFDLKEVSADDCRLVIVASTAKEIVRDLLGKADHYY